MKKYELNIVEYNEFLEFDTKPYPMLLNPLTLEQMKEGLDLTAGIKSFIRDEREAEFLALFLGREVEVSREEIKIDKDKVYIAIRFMGFELPEDMKYLSEDHDIEIYHISLLNQDTEIY